MNNSYNFSPENLAINNTHPNRIKSDWGPQRDPLYIVIPISIIYVSIFITGILGNISTCIVIARNKYMHTATNYYLFSLAISDLLLLISGLPPEIYSIWYKFPYIFGEEFCILQGFAAEASANATVLTIAAFTIERYVAICYPFLSQTLSKLRRAVKYIFYIWLFAIILAIPQAITFGVVCEILNGNLVEEHCICAPKRYIIPYAFEISTVVFFIVPMSLITILYVLIGIQLKKSLRRPRERKKRIYRPDNKFDINAYHHQNVKPEDEGRRIYNKNAYAVKHVVKMLVAVVIAFFICWAPFHAQRLFAIYGAPTSRPMIKAFQSLTYISGVLYYLSTTVNPLLYHIMSHKYRGAFKATYKQCCKKHRHLPHEKCYSSLSAKSSQINSHSTESYPQATSTLKYLSDDLDKRRPIIVSFRKKKNPISNFKCEIHTSRQTLYRSNFPTSIETLQDDPFYKNCLNQSVEEQIDHKIVESKRIEYFELERKCSFMDVTNLQPTHICPLNQKVEFL